jgi:hypothetical protein
VNFGSTASGPSTPSTHGARTLLAWKAGGTPSLFCDSHLSADGSTAWLARPDCTEGYSEEPPF